MTTSPQSHDSPEGRAPAEPGVADSAAGNPSELTGPVSARLEGVIDLMREISVHTDPNEMVLSYGTRVRRMAGIDGFVSVSRRGMHPPTFRVTRTSQWEHTPDPWREVDRQPVFYSGGVVARWLYGDRPQLVNDFACPPEDPMYEFLKGVRSLVAIPNYDRGQALNMTLLYKLRPGGFRPEEFPDQVWTSNLFGRATASLVATRQLREMNEALEREMQTVADIQRSLLPTTTPLISGFNFATFYQTSRNAGGDYYDFFQLGGERLGVLVADVSGHGTPAAVLMAILHAIAHLAPAQAAQSPMAPGLMLAYLNQALTKRYTGQSGVGGMFVTAFYGVLDPSSGELWYASAGHPHGMHRKPDGRVLPMEAAQGLPLGVLDDTEYAESSIRLAPGDGVVLFTDGITEAIGRQTEDGVVKSVMYSEERLREVVGAAGNDSEHGPVAGAIQTAILTDLERFCAGMPPSDDRTMVVISRRSQGADRAGPRAAARPAGVIA